MTLLMIFFTRKMTKDNFLLFSNIYSKIKALINIFLSRGVIFLLEKNYSMTNVFSILLSCTLYVLISMFDSFILFERIKKIRTLSITTREYFFESVRNYLFVYITLLLIFQLRYASKSIDDYIFIAFCILCTWIYQYAHPYIIIKMNKTSEFKNENILKQLYKKCNYKYKIHVYESTKTKSANAITTGTNISRHIFISNYFIENATDEEVFSLLLHECGHVKYFDLEKRLIFINISLIALYTICCLFDYLALKIVPGFIVLFIFCIIAFTGYRRLQHFQEYRADKYSVIATGEKELFASVLKKIYNLNDKKENAFLSAVSSHPSFNKRIEHINSIVFERK